MIVPPRLILFDCDGTLVDSQHLITTAMLQAFETERLDAPAASDIVRIVGLSLDHAITRLQPSLAPEQISRLVAAYSAAFGALRAATNASEPLYPGAAATVAALDAAGFLLGIATGKSQRGLRIVLERHGLLNYFITLQTADLRPSKPHPAMVEHAVAEAGVEAAQTVVVGDTTYDMEMALAAGARAIGVSWGYHETEELLAAGAERVVSDYSELGKWLLP